MAAKKPYKKVDVEKLLSGVDIVKLIDQYVPLKKSGAEFEACCPFHTEKSPSFKVSPTKQIYHCFGCGANGNAIGFVMAYEGKTFPEAFESLGGRGSMAEPSSPARQRAPAVEKKRTAWVPLLPAPVDAPEPPKAHIKRGVPELTWCYRDASGAVLGWVYRFKSSDGGKEVLPLTWCRNAETGVSKWHWMAFPEPRPLYGLDRLAARADAPVLVVEGEKCADAGVRELAELVTVSWPGGGKAVKKVDLSPLAGRKVILWADCDSKRVPLTPEEKAAGVEQGSKPLLAEQEQPGVKTMAEVAAILLGIGCKVWRVKIPAPGDKPDGWDIADAVDDGLTGTALADFVRANSSPVAAATQGGGDSSTPVPAGAGPDIGAWTGELIRKARGGYEDCRENVFLVLQRHPQWAGVIALEEFSNRIIKRRATPFGSAVGEWTGHDDDELGLWLAQRMDLLIKSEGSIVAGVRMVAHKNRFHAVQEYLAATAWDGVSRLDVWLTACLGAEASEYHAIVGRIFLIGMVARAMRPGCRMQYMPILEGKQGKGKSTALRVLGGDWFADTPLRLGDKDTYLAIGGKWLYEVAEMDSFNKRDVTEVKAFITMEFDRFREPYARRMSESPRQTVFAGTTNHGEYFKDSTGNRRFMPIMTGNINIPKLVEWRDQLFAEALSAFNAGEQWHPTREQEVEHFIPEQEKRELTDPWMDAVAAWVDGDPEVRVRKEFTTLQILAEALGVTKDKIDGNRGMATRVGNIMAKLGWSKDRQSTGARAWVYVRPARADQGEDAGVPF